MMMVQGAFNKWRFAQCELLNKSVKWADGANLSAFCCLLVRLQGQ